MGSSIVQGLLASFDDAPRADAREETVRIGVTDIDPEHVDSLTGLDCRVEVAPSHAEATTTILAVKPGTIASVAPTLAPGSRVISIAAGVPTARLRELLPHARAIVRVMPNLPLAVRHGVTLVATSPHSDSVLVEEAVALFGRLGAAYRLDESLLDAGTALSGSGPAFVLLIVEALQEGAIALGIPAGLALELALNTIAGTVALAQARGTEPRSLRLSVTSPGGTTAAGVRALEDAKVRGAIAEALARTAARARELGSSATTIGERRERRET